MNDRPTPDTSAILEYLRVQFPATEGHIPLREKISKLERERDELRTANAVIQEREAALVASKDRISQRAEAIRCELVESEKKSEAMREAIREVENSLQSISAHDGPGFPHGTCCNIAGQALAKLKPFTTGTP